MSQPLVSIVVPTKNGADSLPPLLDAISSQKTDFNFELIAVDSGSSDATVDLLRPRATRLITIPPGSFDHGLTRNLGIEQARGDFVVMLVQDAQPASQSWLASLVAPLRSDDRLAGTFARQLPRQSASGITRHYVQRWLAFSEEPRVSAVSDQAELDRLDPFARLERCTFDNVCSCIRKSVWIRHPFRATPIAEDLEWAREVLLAGYRIAYVPTAVVIHSHDRSARYEFDRTYLLHQRLYALFGLQTIPTAPLLVRAIGSSLGLHFEVSPTLAEKRRGLALAFAWPLGQYLGARSASRNGHP